LIIWLRLTFLGHPLYPVSCLAVLRVGCDTGDVHVSGVHTDLGRRDPVTQPIRRVDDPHWNMGGSPVLCTVRGIRTDIGSLHESSQNFRILRRRRIYSCERSSAYFSL